MLVKQVLPWSVRVWIFAVALWVGVVFCFTQREVDEMVADVKESSITFLKYRTDLRILEDSIVSDREWVENFIEKVESTIKEGEVVLELISDVMCRDFGNIYEHDLTDLDWLPSPFGPNLDKVARVRLFGDALNTVLEPLRTSTDLLRKNHQAYDGSSVLRIDVSEVMKYASFPFIDPKGRYDENLSKSTMAVSWIIVRKAHLVIKSALENYVPPHLTLEGGARRGLVAEWFLQKEGKVLNTSILHELDSLCKKNRLYRLASSPAHTIYVTDYPEALHFVRQLRIVIKELNNFANALSAVMRASGWTDVFRTDSSSAIEKLLKKHHGSTVKWWSRWIVHDVMTILNYETSNILNSSYIIMK